MQITLFGFIWIIFILFAFLSKGYKSFVSLTLFSMIFQSNNVVVNGTLGIGPQIITSSLCLMKLYLVVPFKRIKDKFYIEKITLVFILLIIHIMISTYINVDNFDVVKILNILMIVIYYMLFNIFLKLEFRKQNKFIEKAVFTITSFVIIVGILQMLVVSGVIKGEEFLRILFYNDTVSDSVVFNVKTVKRFYSTFMEPSYAGAYLVGVFNFTLLSEKTNKKNTMFLIVIVISILLTTSTTAYAALFFSILIWLVSKSNKKKIKVLFPIMIIFGLIFTVAFNDVLHSVIFDKSSSGSAIVRNGWNEWALNAFKENPIAGTGYKTQRASSLTYTILGELGGIGFFLHSLFMYLILKPIFRKRTLNTNYKGIFCVLGVLIAQIIACPDLNFSAFWFSMYVLALSNRRIKTENVYCDNTIKEVSKGDLKC